MPETWMVDASDMLMNTNMETVEWTEDSWREVYVGSEKESIKEKKGYLYRLCTAVSLSCPSI